jgi:hypothetical protein
MSIWAGADRQGAVNSLLHLFSRRRPNRTRSFTEDARRLGAVPARLPRLETVDVERIVGSVGRAHELGRDFRPPRRQRRQSDNERFAFIVRALRTGRQLPAVELYRLGDEYYVVDGHHRIAAVLAVGQLAVDAHVTEYVATAVEPSAVSCVAPVFAAA